GESISNFFNSLFGSDQKTAKNYANAASNADAIITVHVDSPERALEAAAILDRHGAIDVDAYAAQSNQPPQNFEGQYNQQQQQQLNQQPYNPQNLAAVNDAATPAATAQNAADYQLQNQTSIPIIEEQLEVGKQIVQREGARIRSRIIEKPVEANLRLREEHIVVNRRPVNREVTDADLTNFREGELVITEHAEVPVVGKQARVVEEIVIGKNVTEHVETVHETVRRNEVEVEQVNPNANNNSDAVGNDLGSRGATS
ncbi:MAG: YsnF/AvaK domain-containing protein, partial [Acidobacteriota bacterium]|nr:YsnF/AvaK domain-containing protein [Acidobacteriota bacterium]